MAHATMLWTYHRDRPGHASSHCFAVEVEFEGVESGAADLDAFREVFPRLQEASRDAAEERVRGINDALELVEGS